MALYSDFNISFEKDELSRDLTLVEDEKAVMQSVKSLVLTSLFERPFQPSIGSTITRLLFEPLDAVTKTILARTIKEVIDQHEPRAELKYVDIYEGSGPNGEQLDPHQLIVNVGFFVFNRPNLVSASIVLRRLR